MNRKQTIWATLDEIRIGERTVSRLSASTVELVTTIARRWRRVTPRPGDALWRVPLACTEQGVGSIPTVSTSCLRSVNG